MICATTVVVGSFTGVVLHGHGSQQLSRLAINLIVWRRGADSGRVGRTLCLGNGVLEVIIVVWGLAWFVPADEWRLAMDVPVLQISTGSFFYC